MGRQLMPWLLSEPLIKLAYVKLNGMVLKQIVIVSKELNSLVLRRWQWEREYE